MDIETLFDDEAPDDYLMALQLDRDLPWVDPMTPARDFHQLVRLAEPLVSRYDDICSPEWEQSPIGWIRQVSSALKRGKIGEELVMGWARAQGLDVQQRRHRGHDCVIEGLELEVKTSLRWNNDRFVFLGLRDFTYDGVVLLGLEPNEVHLWIVPKQVLWEHAKEQTRGASGHGSKWLSFIASNPPTWLHGWGGSFAEAIGAIAAVSRYRRLAEQQIAECESWLELSSEIPWSWQRSNNASASHPDFVCGPPEVQLFDLPDTPSLLTCSANDSAAGTHEPPSQQHPPQGAIHVIHQHQPGHSHRKPDN
jgi:hypothetical protein